MTHDLVIRGGRVIDGTGAAARNADVAVENGKIVAVGAVSGSGRREISAAGAIVTPGFVDIHTHYDGQATWASRMSPSNHHGVTTVVMGNCGVGFAPVKRADHDLLIELMEGVEDIPGAALHEGLSWDWETFPQYLDYLSKRRFDMDIAAQLPHAALRVYVMGERGANREPATAEDIAQMRVLAREAAAAGAIGFSTSRTLNHRSSKGAPTPSLTAEVDELVGIALGLKDAGHGVLELISDFGDLEEEFGIVERMSAASGRPISISLAQGLSPNGWKKILSRIQNNVGAGRVMRGQVAPRPIGIVLGLSTTLNPLLMRPSYSAIAKLPLAERLAKLKDPAVKAKILAEEPAPAFERMKRLVADFDRIWMMNDPPDYEPAPEDAIGPRARALGRAPLEYAYDLLLQRDGRQLLFTPFANYAEFNLDCCREMILSDDCVMGLGDGGAHVGTICDASFSTYLLAHWGRDRTRGERIDLATLVKRQTRDTARAVNLLDRGVIAAGMKADLNVIDFDNLRVRAPEMIKDLPAGGSRLEQRADGYLATIVSGEVTYQNGEATDALPGRLVR
ncbi:MAG TPA: amidohydrolase family protein [Pseudomonadales bacterium]|nr:amidohydrolase family protein [Pseudomonadales bacterium]